MFILITGGSKSGKSSLAEKIICSGTNRRYYIATMKPFGDEAESAIRRHRKMREGKGFITVEQYTDIENADIGNGSDVLLECVGNLCANEMFSAGISRPSEKISNGILRLRDRADTLVTVTNQISSDGMIYPSDTMRYMEELSLIGALLAAAADTVIESVFGIPVVLKGELPKCLL